MATLELDHDELRVHLSWREKAMAVQGDVTVALTSIVHVSAPGSPWVVLRGWRATGVGLPGYVAYGRRRHAGGWDFAAVTNRSDPVLIECNGGRFGQVVVSVEDAAGWAERIAAAAGIAPD